MSDLSSEVSDIAQEIADTFNLKTEVLAYQKPADVSTEFHVKATNSPPKTVRFEDFYPNAAKIEFRFSVTHRELDEDGLFIIRQRLESNLRDCRKYLSDFTACGHYISHRTHGYYCDKCEVTFRNEGNSHKGAIKALAKAMVTPCKS